MRFARVRPVETTALGADMEADQDWSSRAPRSIRRASLRLPKSAGAKGLGWVEPLSTGSRRTGGARLRREQKFNN
jgi:hypothetical protein